jgi:hypothetical protein
MIDLNASSPPRSPVREKMINKSGKSERKK